MDPEQTFIRVQERFSQMLPPKVRVALEYLFLVMAITLFCILVVMHANYVQQPGCSGELSGVVTSEAQLIQIKVTSAGLWSHNDSESNITDPPETEIVKDKIEVSDVNGDELTFLASKFWWNWIGSGARRGKLVFKFWKTDTEFLEHQAETSTSSQNSRPVVEDAAIKIDKEEHRNSFTLSAKETLKSAIVHFGKKWYRRISFIWRHTMQIIGSFQKLWDIAGVHLILDIPKWMHILRLDKLNSNTVQWLKKKSKLFEPTYLYTMEKGYFLLPESAKSHHNIRTVNVSISAWHSCFGNRWQQLLINRFVGLLCNEVWSAYDVLVCVFYYHNVCVIYIERNTDPHAEVYRIESFGTVAYAIAAHGFTILFCTWDGIRFSHPLIFTVQLQHHARHRLPTFQLIFVHVIESLVFVPIMIGILFFLFEFYDDQLLAFMVLILVWLCELFTLISVRTPISMKFFPRFFLLYFLVFHIYFFSYAYGFSYLALSTTAAFMQHLILYFWNRFEELVLLSDNIFLMGIFVARNMAFYVSKGEPKSWCGDREMLAVKVPALQRFMQNRRSQLQQHPDFHITSSTILASTLHITRLNTRNQGLNVTDLPSGAGFRPNFDQSMPQNGPGVTDPQGQSQNNPNRAANPAQIPGQADIRPAAERGSQPWIHEFIQFFVIMDIRRDVRDQGQVFTETPGHENRENQDNNDR
ncbi:Membralin [Sesbania bispinosa]|nr:Membralin [Sesbania bispinosa]